MPLRAPCKSSKKVAKVQMRKKKKRKSNGPTLPLKLITPSDYVSIP
jgi:hypothetical protein